MKTRALIVTATVLLMIFCPERTRAQQAKPSPELPRYEFGIDFTTLTLNARGTNVGVGGRFAYNFNRHIAFDAAGYFSPGKCATCAGEITGNITEGLFGIKVGQRFKKFGIFAKARPGLLSFSQGSYVVTATGYPVGGLFPPFSYALRRRTDFAVDVGGVLEIYPSKKVVLRFDAGGTSDRIGGRTIHSFRVDPVTGAFTPMDFRSPPYSRAYLQLIGGVAFRF